MQKTIYLSFNLTPNPIAAFRMAEINLFLDMISRFGFVPKIVADRELFESFLPESLPYAVINCAGYPTESHLRYLRNLEVNGVKVLNTVYDTKIADDKMLAYIELSNKGIPMPKSIDLNLSWQWNWAEAIEYINNTMGFPCVIKSPVFGFGYGVHKVDTAIQFDDLYGLLVQSTPRFSNGHVWPNLLVQEYIPETFGKCVRVMVLDGQCLGAMFRGNNSDWKTGHPVRLNRNDGSWGGGRAGYNEYREKFELTPELIDLSLKTCKILNLNFAAIDFFFGKDGFLVNEINTAPNITAFHDTNPEINIYEKILEYITKK
jgi:RimK family alpha-L-glutamate ligase